MRRLSPRAIFVIAVDGLRRLIVPAMIALLPQLMNLRERPKSQPRAEAAEGFLIWFTVGFPLLILTLLLVSAIVTYYRTRFGVVGGDFKVLKGGLWRQERTVPLERIQNVLITQSLLERILGIATVKVETGAGGMGAEASLRSLTMADAETLKRDLLSAHRPLSESDAAEGPPVMYRAAFKDLLLAGALRNRALIAIVTVFGLFGVGLDEAIKSTFEGLSRTGFIETAERSPVIGFVIGVVGVFAVVAIGWMLSIGYTVFALHGFKVTNDNRGLHIEYGLFTRVQTVIPVRRVQSITTNAPWLYRLLGLNELTVQSMGGPMATGSDTPMAGGKTILAPICHPYTLRRLVTLVNPRLQIDALTFHGSQRFLILRKVLWSAFGWAFAVGFPVLVFDLASSYAVAWNVLGMAWLALVGLSAWLAFLAWRRQGYAVSEEALVVAHGALGLNVTFVPLRNIQVVGTTSGPILRQLGLVDLEARTPVSAVTVPCLPSAEAEALRTRIVSDSFAKGPIGL